MADATKIGVADATKMGVANARVANATQPIYKLISSLEVQTKFQYGFELSAIVVSELKFSLDTQR